MELPNEIQALLEHKTKNVKSKYLNSIFEKLSGDYINNTGTGKEFLPNQDYVLVYSLSRLNATFSVVDFVLNKFNEYIDDNIDTILDVGAGMGTASINALYHFDLNNIELVEKNTHMMSMGKELLDLYNVNYNYINCDAVKFKSNKKYDLVIASYFLSELEEKTRIKVAENLWDMTNKYLIICDIGTPQGYQNMQNIKATLFDKNAKILLPCPNNNCPLKNDWCHFVTRVNRSKINKLVKNADSPFEDEKFTYAIFGKEKSNLATNIVLRHPIKEKSVVKVQLCQKDKITQDVITKNHKLYKVARKVKIGDELKLKDFTD
ncbi:MAG: methyltransferase domain-containing protein [Clostridia bacterium]|nr:methyltransferase domain-containing protein [Clostridia bacterium]